MISALLLLSGCRNDTPLTRSEPAGSAGTSATNPAGAGVTIAPRASTSSSRAIAAPPASEGRLPDRWERPPDIEYVATPEIVVKKMLEVAELKKGDVLYDLGCGDGRIVVTAAKQYGVKAVGFDIDPQRVREARANVEQNGVSELAMIELKDIFQLDLRPASVVTLYLSPRINAKLIPQLEKLAPGSRIVSHDFDIAGVVPERTFTVLAPYHRPPHNETGHFVFLWRTPLRKSTP